MCKWTWYKSYTMKTFYFVGYSFNAFLPALSVFINSLFTGAEKPLCISLFSPNTFKWTFKLIFQFFYYKIVIVFWSIMKNCRDFIRHVKFQIANAVCWTSVVAMISNFSIVCIIKEIFYEIFSANSKYSCFFVCFLTLCLLLVTFFSLLNPIILIACSFEGLQNFFHTIFSSI